MLKLFDLSGKTILITGASSGIGKQCAISCSEMGATVIIVGRNEERLIKTIQCLKGEGHIYSVLDLTEYDKLEKIITDTVKKYSSISGMIHAAGIEMTIPLRVLKPSNFENIFSINVIAGIELARIISQKKFLSSKGASYIFIASVMGIVGKPGLIAYCASKGALIAASKAMSLELARSNIRVNTISPAAVDTEMIRNSFSEIPDDAKQSIIDAHPMGIGLPEDVAAACVFLLSDASRWITGTNLIVDGGYSAK
jgi:NAD(P)-dependent dehydrogenase (short-subunit alcohol dehydrogenase family)